MTCFSACTLFLTMLSITTYSALCQSTTAAPDTQAPAPAPAATPAAGPTWSIGGIDFSGFVDGYYEFNANHPADEFNQYRNFDEKANQFSLNLAKVTLSHDPDPIGFRLDIGFGRAFETVHATEQSSSIFRNIEQAYISLKPPKAKGFEADFGEFVTSAGAEVIETKDNWNYSRSILFAYAIPYYHFGLRTSIPVTKTITGGFQLVNGWNNVEDNNSGKTLGFTGALTKPKFTWNVNYYTGPEKPNTNKGWRNLIDTTLLMTPNSKVNFYLNYDYAQERNLDRSLSHYQGFAGAAHEQLTSHFALAQRAEYFNDPQGFSTATTQSLNEFTLTGEYKWVEGLLTRLEYRRDHSDHNVFMRGPTPAADQNQNTVSIGFIGFFGPKR
ncbi:MAG TPA: porin [Acidisarcina sp.]|nr:porin [Acidisarcina sp.]